MTYGPEGSENNNNNNNNHNNNTVIIIIIIIIIIKAKMPDMIPGRVEIFFVGLEIEGW